MKFQLLILCRDNDGPYTIQHTADAAWSDVELAACVRSLIDAHRVITPGTVRYIGCLVIERDGPLTLNEPMRLFCEDSGNLIANKTELNGARLSAGLGRWVGLRTVKGAEIGKGTYRQIANAVCACDLGAQPRLNQLTLPNGSPLLELNFPLFQGWLEAFPELDNVQLPFEGDAVARDVDPLFQANEATYELKQHMAFQTVPLQAREFHTNMLRHVWAGQTAAREYTKMMGAFGGRWGDNWTPDEDGYNDCWKLGIYAASVWYHVARRLGHQIPDPNPSFLGSPDVAAISRGLYYDDAFPVSKVKGNEPLILAIVQRLYTAQRTLESSLQTLTLASGLQKVHKDVVYEGRPLWISTREESSGQLRRVYHRTEPVPPPPYDIFTMLVYTRCFDQHRIENQWLADGGAAYARVFYDLFPVMTKALFEAVNLSYLIASVWQPDGTKADYWKRRVAGGITRTPYTEFVPVQPVDNDFRFGGDACAFIAFVPWERGPFYSTVQSCGDDVLSAPAGRVPIERVPFPWNHETDPYPHSETFREWIQGNRDGTLAAAQRETAALWRRWSKTVNDYTDTFLPPHDD